MRQRRLKNEINVVPYIDVMLVLLVIFMVATPMMSTGSVNLPSAGASQVKPDKFLRVQVEADGRLTIFDINGKKFEQRDIKALRSELPKLSDGNKELAILIAGDQQTLYKNVTEILAEVKKAGFSRVALETQQ